MSRWVDLQNYNSNSAAHAEQVRPFVHIVDIRIVDIHIVDIHIVDIDPDVNDPHRPDVNDVDESLEWIAWVDESAI